MTRKKPIQPGEKIGLMLTQAQRSLLLDALLPIRPDPLQAAARRRAGEDPGDPG